MLRCRPDTFSLGVCNGCQLMALLGWVPGGSLPDTEQPRFVHNASGRFECRWATVEIRPSPSVLLKVRSYAGGPCSVHNCWCAMLRTIWPSKDLPCRGFFGFPGVEVGAHQ